MSDEQRYYKNLKEEDLEKLTEEQKSELLQDMFSDINKDLIETTRNLRDTLDRIDAMEEKRDYHQRGKNNYLN